MELLLAFLGVAYKHRKESRPQRPALSHGYSAECLCAESTFTVLAGFPLQSGDPDQETLSYR